MRKGAGFDVRRLNFLVGYKNKITGQQGSCSYVGFCSREHVEACFQESMPLHIITYIKQTSYLLKRTHAFMKQFAY